MKLDKKIILLTIVCMMFFLSESMASGQVFLRIGYEDWPPFQYQNETKKVTGLDIELVSAILDTAGIKASFELKPWKRILYSVDKGFLDIALSATPTEERKKYADFSISYRDETYSLQVRKGESHKFPFKTLQDLADHTTFLVGNVRGCYLGEAFENLSKNPAFAKRIQEVPKDIQNIRKAVAGRIDGFFAEPNYVVYTTRQMGWGNKFEIHPMPVISSPVHLMLSKKTISPELKNKINQGIEKIKADGRHRAIIESYLK